MNRDSVTIMDDTKHTVLITGCSDGSLGSALALAFHKRGGYRIFATARSTNHMSSLQEAGIETFELDATSDSSIRQLVEHISSLNAGKLDILVNSVGGGHYMPFYHLDLQKARELFDINVWGFVAVTQAFLPLLMQNTEGGRGVRNSIIVNNTSISSVLRTPYHSAYGASKAAMAAFNDAQRIELAPCGINVVDLKTGSLETNFRDNKSNEFDLPKDSPYQPIEEDVMKVITGQKTEAYAEDRHKWADEVLADLLKDTNNPPAQIWRGGAAGTIQISSGLDNMIPADAGDRRFQALGGLDKLAKILKKK